MAEKTPKKKTTTKTTTSKSKSPSPKKSASPKTTDVAKKKPAAKKKASLPKPPAIKKEAKSTKIATKKVPPTKSTSFENDAAKVELTLHPACSAHLHVALTEKTIQEAHAAAIKDVSKSISLPGFRKGKVPKSLVEKNYASSILEQQSKILIQKGLDISLALTKLRPLNYRNVKPTIEKQTEKEAEYTYSFETYPEIPAIPVDKIKLDKITTEEITDQKVEEVIDIMRSYQAKWEPIEDRGIETGDYVDLDILNLETDSPLVSKKRVQVENGKLSKWLIDLLIGMKKDETKEGMSKWDDSLPASEKKGFKSTKCKVTALGVFKGDLPPVDETFAKAMGTQSIAELRTQVLMRLRKNAEVDCENQQKVLLDQALEKLVDFELPKTLLDAEIKTKLDIKKQQLAKKKFSKEEEKQHEEEALKEAKVALKLFFILQKIANDNNIIVSEQELREVLSERLSQLNLPPEVSSNQQYKNQLIQEMRMNCFIDILTEKVKHHLLKQVAFV